jgi:hypothetical protein
LRHHGSAAKQPFTGRQEGSDPTRNRRAVRWAAAESVLLLRYARTG